MNQALARAYQAFIAQTMREIKFAAFGMNPACCAEDPQFPEFAPIPVSDFVSACIDFERSWFQHAL